MATNRTRRTRNRTSAGGITDTDYLFYTFGEFFEAENYADGKTENDLREFYLKHRTAIMERYLDENQRRGHRAVRPWSWWKWSAPEPQRPTPPGKFSSQRVWNHKRGVFEWVETDVEYLSRLNLLEPWETNT